MRKFVVYIILILLIASIGFAQQGEIQRGVTKLAGDLYHFQNNFHYSVFLVTDDGVIVTDPINADAAQALKAHIAEEFNLPIRYVIYSHDHADHISGGEVFAADGAVVVAHENVKSDIIGEGRSTAIPNITFSDTLNLELGGKTVELTYVGKNHSDGTIVMNFPDERALFAVDFIPTGKSLPYKNLSDSFFPDWINSLEIVENMDFDLLVPGHGEIGDKTDVSNLKGYMQDLYDAVLEQARAGKTLEETIEVVKLEEYSDWEQYEEWLPLNIEGVYNRIQLHRR